MTKLIRRTRRVLTNVVAAVSSALGGHGRVSYSQEGEDLFLDRVFDGRRSGFYVDIGAHHPKRFSNTCLFYMRGWNGINVDASAELMEAFRVARKRDTNLTAAVGEVEREETLYVFDEPALNTLDEEVARARERESPACKVIREETVQVTRLASVLSKNVPPGTVIDFLSVDVEGRDLEVLRSNDWTAFRPAYVLAESLSRRGVEQALGDPVTLFMMEQGYELRAKLLNTLVFEDSRT